MKILFILCVVILGFSKIDANENLQLNQIAAVNNSYENVFTSFVSVDPTFFNFVANYGYLYLFKDGQDLELYAILLEDGSVWGFLASQLDSFSILNSWTYGDWVTILPSPHVHGEYLIENKVRTPGQPIAFQLIEQPSQVSKMAVIEEKFLNENSVALKIKGKFFSTHEASQMTIIRQWDIGDVIYVNKVTHVETSEDTLVVTDKILLINTTKGNSAEATP